MIGKSNERSCSTLIGQWLWKETVLVVLNRFTCKFAWCEGYCRIYYILRSGAYWQNIGFENMLNEEVWIVRAMNFKGFKISKTWIFIGYILIELVSFCIASYAGIRHIFYIYLYSLTRILLFFILFRDILRIWWFNRL